MHVGGSVRFLRKFESFGELRLIGARIDGSLDFSGATLESCGEGAALDLADAAIGGSLFLIDHAGRRVTIRGRIDMGSACVSGQVLIRNARIEERGTVPIGSGYSRSRAGGTALSAPRLSVGAEVTLEGNCQITGGLDLAMSDMSSFSIGNGCSLTASGRDALDLSHAEIRSSLAIGRGVVVHGTLRLTSAHIHGNLILQGVALRAPKNKNLVGAQGLTVDGDVELQDIRAEGGQLGFRSARLGSVVDAAGACLTNPGGYTLSLHQAIVKGSVRLVDGFESEGLLMLNRSIIEGRLQCTGGSFSCPAPSATDRHGHAMEAICMDLGWTTVSPSVDFTNASTTFLADEPASWPSSFSVSGFIYDRFEQPQGTAASTQRTWDQASRCAWLRHQTLYDAGPL